MSDLSPDVAGLITEASQIQIANSILISGTTLLFYDYAMTLSTEISEMWNSKFSAVQALFFLTRYSYMVFTVLLCISVFYRNPSEMLCRVLSFNLTVWNTLPQIGVYGVLTLRTYAIYQKNPSVLVIMGLPSVALTTLVICDGIASKSATGNTVFGSNCAINERSIILRIQLADVVLVLLLDILVFTLTFAKTIHLAIEMRKLRLANGLGYFILRDGTMYFLAKLVFGVTEATIFFVHASDVIGNWLAIIPAILDPLTIILISRLVLNLRQVAHIQEGNAPTLRVIGTIQEPAFAANSLLGNIGAPLRVGPDDDDEMEEIGVEDEAVVVEERTIVNHTEIVEEPREPSHV